MTNIGNLIKLVFTAIPVDVLINQTLQYHQLNRLRSLDLIEGAEPSQGSYLRLNS